MSSRIIQVASKSLPINSLGYLKLVTEIATPVLDPPMVAANYLTHSPPNGSLSHTSHSHRGSCEILKWVHFALTVDRWTCFRNSINATLAWGLT
jgi:hypothetical protein